MKNKTALITGSTSGIGLGIARKFAEAGYNIAFNGLEPNGEEIAQQIADEFKVKHVYSNANMTKPEEIRAFVAQTEEKFGSIEVLINNAGVQFVSPIEDFPDEKWDAIIAINLSATFHTIKAVMRSMKERKYGRIINMSSGHGLVGSIDKVAYCASKHGVLGITKTIAIEGADFGITCNAICPGAVQTAMVDKEVKKIAEHTGRTEEDVIINTLLKNHAIKEYVSIDTLANTALFLASDTAKSITGVAMPVDGGWMAQ